MIFKNFAEQSEKSSLCELCGIQGHKYTCPSCDLRYCSLRCYKSQTHADCVEDGFYKKQVIDALKGTSISTEERATMVNILKAFEETREEEEELESEEDTRFDCIEDGMYSKFLLFRW